ncbi:MAG: DNA repair protein RecO [Alphaproteobacteria bacterium]
MEWNDKAIVLHVRPHGETSVVLEVLARGQGRHLGLVRGGRSRKLRPLLQTGNLLRVEWRARLAEHLGFFTVEMGEPFAARALDDRLALAGISTLASLASLLPERDPHTALFDLAALMLQHLDEAVLWPQILVRWELALLGELGFGLDLASCAATGATEGLIYVSPKSGRAVSAEAGAPYAHLMLPLPGFLLSGGAIAASPADIADGLRLTGFFMEQYVLTPRGQQLPESRAVITKWLVT